MTQRLTGLFLGAGASYEVGLPLVWELTSELKQWLTAEKLRALNQGWRVQGGGYPDPVIDDLAGVLERPELHYESILGYLETQFRRHSGKEQHHHGLYLWLVEMVYHILYLRHVNSRGYVERSLGYLDGLGWFASKNAPLWVFSLNHDLIVECAAARLGLPVCSGFAKEVVRLPRRDKAGAKIGEIRAETISGDQLERSGMPFLQPGTPGINLLKIHGALDVFAFRDGKDLLKLIPDEASPKGVIAVLKAANEDLLYPTGDVTRPVKATNEIAFADEEGEMQFLRRTLLAGAYKFDKRHSQVLPYRLLDYFRSYINYISTLVCIGYGFGDIHINQVIREWLEFSAERRIEIIEPGEQRIPAFGLHLAPQVTLRKATATEYLDSAAGITRTRRELLEKRFAAWARKMGTSKATAELQSFIHEHERERARVLAERIAALPLRDGDIDIDALGMSPDELAQQILSEPGNSLEDVLETFLSSRSL